MEDPNLIAYLYPADRNHDAWDAIHLRENSGRYIPPQEETKPEYGRESTVSVEDDDDKDDPKFDPKSYPGLQLTFNSGPKAGQGFMFGTHKNRCDIVLPKLEDNKIGRLHCVLTFDAERRLILRDLSKHGTIVTYNGQGEKRRSIVTYDDKGREKKRHHFTWILSGREASKVEKVVIQIQEIKFQIIVSRHETYPDLYNNNVDRFLQEANADDELPLGGLGIQSTSSTAQQSEAHTPIPQMPVYINQWRLGSGHFSIVNRVWDVSTGSIYASKEFYNMKESDWRKEASITRQLLHLSNEHIVQFISLVEKPTPQLILEYLPLGNLQDQDAKQPITDQESLTVLCQSLDALTSVHDEDIAHRDIKPENILIQSREPLHIKLSDFGLGKATADLQTFCGTHLYTAPEIYTKSRTAYYTKACDIWSLAVVVFKYAYGPLPDIDKTGIGLPWCKEIIKRADDWDSDILLDFLLTAMLVIKPDKRLPSRNCWELALQLSVPSQSRCPTPTQASYSESDCLEETSALEASRDRSPSMLETNMWTALGTVDHYLIGYDTEKQELEDQRSLVNPSNEGVTRVRKASKTKRKASKTNSTPSLQEGRSHTPTESTRHPSSTVRRSKRVRQERLDLQYARSVDGADIFGKNWLLHPNYVGSSVAALGEDVDEGSRLSKWTTFRSESPIPASTSDIANEQSSNYAPPFEGAGGRFVLEDYQPVYQSGIERGQTGRSSGEPTDRPTEDERAQRHVIPQSVKAVQVIRFRTQTSLICATDLIQTSSKRRWPKSLILEPYETTILNKTQAFISYPDGLDLASRLKLPIGRLRDAMNKKVSQVSIEISKDEAEAIDTESLIVHIWPSRSLINATNLFAVRQCSRNYLTDLLACGLHLTHCRAYGMQGTYISYADGLRLCNALGFSENRLDQIRDAMIVGWLGPIIHQQHEPSVDFRAVKSEMAAEKAANDEEFLLPRTDISLYACSTIGVSKKLFRKGGGDQLDDRYYEGLDLEDEGIGFDKYAGSFT